MPCILKVIVGIFIVTQSFGVRALAGQADAGDDEFKSARLDQKTHAIEAIHKASVSSQDLQKSAAQLQGLTDPASRKQREIVAEGFAANEKTVEKLEAEFPDAGVKTAAAEFSLQTNDNAKALARSDEAVKLAFAGNAGPPVVAEALRARAMAYAAAADYAKANADAKRVLTMYPDNELADRIEKLTRGRAPMEAKLPKNAPPPEPIQELIDLARSSPINRPAGYAASVGHNKEAETDLKLGDYRKMYDEASKAVARMPDNPKAYMQRAFAALMLKNYEQVVKDTEEGLKLKPGSSALLGLRAAAYNETGKPQKALEDAARAVEDNPKDPFAWLQKGLAREKLDEHNDEYLSDIRNAAELDPSFEHFYTEALARRGQGNAASAPAGSARPGIIQRWVLPVATVTFCLLLVAAGFARMLLKRPQTAAVLAAKGSAEGRLLAGQFRVVRELGRGGMGVVYEAWDTRLERTVAIKKLMDDQGDQNEERARLLKEAKTVAALRHDNIVVIHSAFEDEGRIYCVFEKVEGETLQDFLESRGRLEPAESVNYISPVCSALDYAHRLKIIHRDLKPSNVMLEGGKIKVMDFGIARRMKGGKGVTVTEMVVGTPAYMAPELQFGEVSPESDLYALGVMAYQLLSGRLPFEGRGSAQDKNDMRFPPASTFAKNAPGLDDFFKRALAPDRKDRFHSGAELLAALRQALA